MRVVRELDSGGYDLFHYSGHVAVPFDTSYVGLRLHEDKLLDERVLRSLSNTGVPPIVFVNGCASADRLGNLCVSFMATGAKVVIGTRYEVAEDSARRFAERFYAALIGGAPAGAAVRLARQDLRRHADIGLGVLCAVRRPVGPHHSRAGARRRARWQGGRAVAGR